MNIEKIRSFLSSKEKMDTQEVKRIIIFLLDESTNALLLVKERIELTEMKNKEILKVVDSQAEDEGIWFDAETITERYLQQELRKLHFTIEQMLR